MFAGDVATNVLVTDGDDLCFSGNFFLLVEQLPLFPGIKSSESKKMSFH